MLLYDIHYEGGTMDRATRLPLAPAAGTRYAVCVNGERTYYVPAGDEWAQATASEATGRKLGRPVMPEGERQGARVEVRMTESQRAKLDQLGGAAWIRSQIDRAKIPRA
ncbi:MAG: hypothetical protein KGH96_23365 [Sphingomonadales bacterium]|nr:hypothetical protein [Sphingomonadales bacterium]